MNTFEPIKLRELAKSEKDRLSEVIFYMIIDQIIQSKAISNLPMGTTVPKLLAGLLGLNSNVIDYAFNMLVLPANKPTTDEMVLALKTNGVPSSRSMFTPETYYKALRRRINQGEPELETVLSELQRTQIKKFNRKYSKALFGKRKSLVGLLNDRKENTRR